MGSVGNTFKSVLDTFICSKVNGKKAIAITSQQRCIDCSESCLAPFKSTGDLWNIVTKLQLCFVIWPFIPPLANTVVASLNGILFV